MFIFVYFSICGTLIFLYHQHEIPFHHLLKHLACRVSTGSFLHLFLHIDVELADTLKGQLLLLYKDPDRFTHELLCDIQNISWHGGRQEDNLKK